MLHAGGYAYAARIDFKGEVEVEEARVLKVTKKLVYLGGIPPREFSPGLAFQFRSAVPLAEAKHYETIEAALRKLHDDVEVEVRAYRESLKHKQEQLDTVSAYMVEHFKNLKERK